MIQAVVRDRHGTLWVAGLRSGVFRRRGAAWERYSAPGTHTTTISADSAGRTWLGYADGRLVQEGVGAARVYGPADGLRVGSVLVVAVQGQRVWVGGELGVAVTDDRVLRGRDGGDGRARFSPLVTADGPLRSVSGIVPTHDAVWLSEADGVARISSAEVARALRDPDYRVHAERFDARDRLDAPGYHTGSTAVQGTDGRLWFTWLGGMGWIDPTHVRRNRIPPPVLVRGLSAGGRAYAAAGRLTLPKRTRALSVVYTALSLAVPERVRFRHRLVGLDTAWQDAGARREAFYTNVGPGEYRFEVTAANEDGVWSVRPAPIDVVIPPAFVQTNAFLTLCATAAGGGVWTLALWRQRRAVAAARARSEVAFAERMRVARELHDTLLTDVAGLRMQLDAAARAAGPAGVPASLVATIRDQASRTLVNARRAVVDIRAGGDDAGPVAVQVGEAARRNFAGTDVEASVERTGRVRRYAPAVEAEALRIACKALANARNHAACRSVLVTCGYGRRELRLEVRDDGRGFDPAQPVANGHFGLVGMRERAAALGAQLTVESAPGRGTAILLAVPVTGKV